ncbi:MAG: tetratricopeptide repeat protein [Myxococcota bacterium]|nr:tetratricopeptide repeat protein [Myxococcota bacterium]
MENGAAYAEAGALNEAVIEYRNVLQLDPNLGDAHYALAKIYLGLKQGNEAYWEFSESVRLDSSNVDARLTLGGLSLVTKNFEDALEQADRIIELDPSHSTAYVLRAQALEQLDRAGESEADYLKAIELESDEGSYLLATAMYYSRQKNRAKAEPLLQKLTEVDPTFRSYTSLARFLAEDRERAVSAQAAFERASETAEDADKASATQNLANYLYLQDRPDAALALLEAAIEEDESGSKGKLDLIYLLARLYAAQGNVERADELIESATSAVPGDSQPHLILSAYRGRKGDLEGALESAEAALVIDPDDTNVQLRKAELMIDLGYRSKDEKRVTAGQRIVEAVLENEPTNPNGLFVMGKLKLALADAPGAIKALRAAIDSRPNWAQAHFVLASALTLVGDTNGARASVARAVRFEPGMLEARRLLAQLHASLGEHEYAVEQGRKYLTERPRDVKTRIVVAQSLVRLGRADEAREALEAVSEEDATADLLYAKARLQLARGEGESTRKLLLRAAEMKPHHPQILRGLLALDRISGRIGESKIRIEAAVKERPDDAELARVRGELALAERDYVLAEQSLRRATELDPTNMEAYQQLASFYQASGQLDETLETFERALEQQPDEARLHHSIAVLYELAGRVDDAVVGYERAIELDSSHGQAKNNLAYLLTESGRDLDRALDLAKDAKSLLPGSGNAADTLGWVLYKHGRASAAVGYLNEAVATIEPGSPNLGIVRHHLAQAYEASDQHGRAVETLEEALAELERKMAAIRSQGGKPVAPEWSESAREMLRRLKPAG